MIGNLMHKHYEFGPLTGPSNGPFSGPVGYLAVAHHFPPALAALAVYANTRFSETFSLCHIFT